MSLKPFTECTKRAANTGNWEIIRKKSRRKTSNLYIKSAQQLQILPVGQVKRALIFIGNKTVWGTLSKKNLLQWGGSC